MLAIMPLGVADAARRRVLLAGAAGIVLAADVERALVMVGMPSREIARQLFLAESTVKTHLVVGVPEDRRPLARGAAAR